MGILVAWIVSLAASPAAAALADLSLEELMAVEVTSVSKAPEKRIGAAAAISVITGEDIRRSGARTLADALRLVPGVHVAKIAANQWSVSIRGDAGIVSNQLLVLIDGRSVYTPLFAGVFWDAQDTLLEDVDRIEVIRGPGGTLWGANAVNGVVNVITKSATDTQGGFVEVGGGTEERAFAGLRHGGTIGEDLAFRIYGKAFERDGGIHGEGPGDDDWRGGQVGFRVDWEANRSDRVTVQGDLYGAEVGLLRPLLELSSSDLSGSGSPSGDLTTEIAGGNLLGRFTRSLSDDSEIVLQTYYDRTERDDPSFRDVNDTFDFDLHHRFALPFGHEGTWGLQYRVVSSAFDGPWLMLDPRRSTDHLFSGFVQDHVELLDDRLRFTAGTKLEHNDFTGFEVQPSARVAFDAAETQTIWAAVSRAVRIPSRIDTDSSVDLDGGFGEDLAFRLEPGRDVRAENLLAWETGYRWLFHDDLLFDVAAFYFDYEDLVTFEIRDPVLEGDRLVVPVERDNLMSGSAYGVEVAADWSPFDRWRLRSSYSHLQIDLNLASGSRDRAASLTQDASPEHQATLASFLDLPRGFELDGALRWVSRVAVPFGDGEDDDSIAPYWGLDVRLGWRLRSDVELSLIGQNLLSGDHREFGGGSEVQRGVYGKVAWRF